MWTPFYFASFIVDILKILIPLATPTHTHAQMHVQSSLILSLFQPSIFHCYSSFPDKDTWIGVETLES